MTTPQSPLRELERVVALVEKATPGPREALTPCEPHDYVTDIRSDDDGQLVAATYTEHDGRMIAAAVNFIRDHGSALIAELGQEVGAVDEDAQDVPVWTLLGLAEQCGAVRDSDDNSTWWTLGLDAAYKLEEMLRAHGVSAGWASSPAHTSEARDAERYRALKTHFQAKFHRATCDYWVIVGELKTDTRFIGEDGEQLTLDNALDAAIAAMRQEGE